MLDLVHEEERVAHLTGLGFEELLDALDRLDPGRLSDRYAEVTDGYMTLAGKGRRTREQNIALDRLDSALRMLLGERGLLVLAGRLLHIQRAAMLGLVVFGKADPGAGELLLLQQGLARAAQLAEHGLRGPIPVDGPGVADKAGRASAAAAALVHLRAGTGWLFGWSRRARVAEEGLSGLLGELAERDAARDAWQAAGELFDPAGSEAKELVCRLGLCRKVAGFLGCREIAWTTAGLITDLAGLVREGLGA